MKKKKLLSFISLLAGLGAIFCYRLHPKRSSGTPPPLSFQATSTLDGIRITRYRRTETRALIYTIEATRFERLALEEMSLLHNPTIRLLGQDGVEIGRLQSQYATLIAQETLYLSEGVRIQHRDKEHRLYTLQAESAYCSLTTQSFSAGTPVTSQQAGITSITEWLSGTF